MTVEQISHASSARVFLCLTVYLYVFDSASFFFIVAYGINATAGILDRRYSIHVLVGFGWVPCHITAHGVRNFKEGLGAFSLSGATESSAC